MWMMKPKENSLNDVRTFTAVMVGYYATGKSAILDRFCRNCFDEDYRMTLNSSHGSRLLCLDTSFSVRLNLIDTLGNGFGRQLISNSVPDSDALLLVYDITNQQSFYRLQKWLGQMHRVLKKSVLTVLVGTHLDQPYKRKVSTNEALRWKKNNQINMFFQVSSKTNENINDMFGQISKTLALMRSKANEEKTVNADLNPEMSMTTVEEGKESYKMSSRLTVLQKKLSFKEMECERLWADYEQALKRIGQLQSYKSEGSNTFLSSFKYCESESEDIEGKIKGLEQNIRTLEQFYTNKQVSLEESSCRRIRELNQQIEMLNEQIENFKEVQLQNKHEIAELLQSRNEMKAKVGELQFDLQQKSRQQKMFQDELSELLKEMAEKTSLLHFEESEPVSPLFSILAINTLHRKFAYLITALDERQHLILEKDYSMKQLACRNQAEKRTYEEQIERLDQSKKAYEQEIDVYEQRMIGFRAQVVRKVWCEGEIQRLNRFVVDLESRFDIKSQEYLEIIGQKEKTIKVLLGNCRNFQERLELVKRQYEELHSDHQEKTRLLQKKEEIMSRVISQKMSEIQQLRGFISEVGKTSSKIVKKYSKSLEESNAADQAEKNMIVEFFTHFFERFQARSIDILERLQQNLHAFQNIGLALSELKEAISQVEIVEDWDCSEELGIEEKERKLSQFKQFVSASASSENQDMQVFARQYEGILIEIRNLAGRLVKKISGEANGKISKASERLPELMGELDDIISGLRDNLQEIHSSVSQIEGIIEVGVEQYIKQYFN